MRFQVPQFIEVEDKIFGPLTFKQFVYLAGAAGLSALAWLVLPIYIAIPIVLAAVALGVSLAFLKINEKPFIDAMQAAFFYALKHKLYIWRKEEKMPESRKAEIGSTNEVYIPKLSESKLKEISWALDVEDLSKRNQEIESKTGNNRGI